MTVNSHPSLGALFVHPPHLGPKTLEVLEVCCLVKPEQEDIDVIACLDLLKELNIQSSEDCLEAAEFQMIEEAVMQMPGLRKLTVYEEDMPEGWSERIFERTAGRVKVYANGGF
jgi:hypothetical protein